MLRPRTVVKLLLLLPLAWLLLPVAWFALPFPAPGPLTSSLASGRPQCHVYDLSQYPSSGHLQPLAGYSWFGFEYTLSEGEGALRVRVPDWRSSGLEKHAASSEEDSESIVDLVTLGDRHEMTAQKGYMTAMTVDSLDGIFLGNWPEGDMTLLRWWMDRETGAVPVWVVSGTPGFQTSEHLETNKTDVVTKVSEPQRLLREVRLYADVLGNGSWQKNELLSITYEVLPRESSRGRAIRVVEAHAPMDGSQGPSRTFGLRLWILSYMAPSAVWMNDLTDFVTFRTDFVATLIQVLMMVFFLFIHLCIWGFILGSLCWCCTGRRKLEAILDTWNRRMYHGKSERLDAAIDYLKDARRRLPRKTSGNLRPQEAWGAWMASLRGLGRVRLADGTLIRKKRYDDLEDGVH